MSLPSIKAFNSSENLVSTVVGLRTPIERCNHLVVALYILDVQAQTVFNIGLQQESDRRYVSTNGRSVVADDADPNVEIAFLAAVLVLVIIGLTHGETMQVPIAETECR